MREVRDGTARVSQLAERREDRIAAAVHMVSDMMIPRTSTRGAGREWNYIFSCSALHAGDHARRGSVVCVIHTCFRTPLRR